VWPLHGVVTSEYGPRSGGFHPGIDISDPTGTPIHAAGPGQVIYAGWDGDYGNFVLIDHGGGIVTGYGHQSQIAVGQGEMVSQGQVIGYVGSTGNATGPHVHFEVRVNGSPENPRAYIPGSP
jgi:murein DD-endopeptidase MepM/ murein hydrolase activator NlpD